jgi:biopolymer transport protein ExbB/TolQ
MESLMGRDPHTGSSSPLEPALHVQRRLWTRAAWIGGLLCAGPILGLVGMTLGMAQSFRVIESVKAPTPDQLRAGVEIGLISTTAGVAAGLAGTALLVYSLWKLDRLRSRLAGTGASSSQL